jgi:hypothetical protein
MVAGEPLLGTQPVCLALRPVMDAGIDSSPDSEPGSDGGRRCCALAAGFAVVDDADIDKSPDREPDSMERDSDGGRRAAAGAPPPCWMPTGRQTGSLAAASRTLMAEAGGALEQPWLPARLP